MSTYTTAIVGAKFRPPAACVLAALSTSCALIVRREPTNAYDTNALQVLVRPSAFGEATRDRLKTTLPGFGFSLDDLAGLVELHLGYVPRERAAEISPLFDAAGLVETNAKLTFSPEGQPRVQFSLSQTEK